MALTDDVCKLVVEVLILSKLDYCCIAWGSALNQDSSDQLQKLQNKAARLILSCNIDEVLRRPSHAKLGWLTVRQRIYIRTLMMLHKVLYTSEPMTIYKHLLPFQISHGYDTRFLSRCKLDNLL